jgi:hypothetical protein
LAAGCQSESAIGRVNQSPSADFIFITLEVGGEKSEDCRITTVTGFVNPESNCFFFAPRSALYGPVTVDSFHTNDVPIRWEETSALTIPASKED